MNPKPQGLFTLRQKWLWGRRIAVTVCIAGICEGTSIVGASDRMITAGDVEYEPPQTKVVSLTTSIAAMIAGDAALQTEIFMPVFDKVNAQISTLPNDWVPVRTVADWYYEIYRQVRNSRIEQMILNPLGLDRNTFISRQNELQSQLAMKLAGEILNFDMPEIETIVAGVDSSGPHIFVVDNKGVTARDSVGFAAIGAGYWHANSQFMFSEYARWKPMPEVLLLTYAAKRRAEVAPGVGQGTDMFMIGPNLGSYFAIGGHVLTSLDGIYGKTKKNAEESLRTAKEEVTTYLDELTKKSQEVAGIPAPAQTAPPALPEGGTDVKDGQEAKGT
jgi:20S proteasome alpha/beta subunit